jgi:hypothetical protein
MIEVLALLGIAAAFGTAAVWNRGKDEPPPVIAVAKSIDEQLLELLAHLHTDIDHLSAFIREAAAQQLLNTEHAEKLIAHLAALKISEARDEPY